MDGKLLRQGNRIWSFTGTNLPPNAHSSVSRPDLNECVGLAVSVGVLSGSVSPGHVARLSTCGLNGRSSFGEMERTRNMMMIPVQVIAFFIAVMLIPAYVREFTIELQGKKRFLLFLKREPDGRYVPLTGQTDPHGGVKDLGTYP